MTDLHCSVRECTYNNQDRCCAGQINVEGHHACECSETCCETYQDRCECGCKNEVPSPNAQVGCSVITCIYNENQYCHADHILINGSDCHHSRDTRCDTFVSR